MKKIIFSLLFCGSLMIGNAQDTLAQYTGKYLFPEGSVVPDVEVLLSDGSLSMVSSAGTSSLVQLGVDSFQIVEFSGTSVFKRGDDKKVNGVHIEAGGYILDGKKQENGSWVFRSYYRPPHQDLLLTRR